MPCGGHVAGKKDLVAAAAARLSAPGLGVEFGSVPRHVMRAMFQGLFLAPQMVGEAVKVDCLSVLCLFEQTMHAISSDRLILSTGWFAHCRGHVSQGL